MPAIPSLLRLLLCASAPPPPVGPLQSHPPGHAHTVVSVNVYAWVSTNNNVNSYKQLLSQMHKYVKTTYNYAYIHVQVRMCIHEHICNICRYVYNIRI